MNSTRNANLNSKSSLPALPDRTDAGPGFHKSPGGYFQGLSTLSCGQIFNMPRSHLDTFMIARATEATSPLLARQHHRDQDSARAHTPH